MDLSGKGVIVTGASRGLGEELAVTLARRGAKVVLVARNEKELLRVCTRIEKEGGAAFAITADIADKDAVHRVASEAAGFAGPIEVLVNNAGTLGPVPLAALVDTDCEDLERAFAVNVIGPFRLTKIIAGAMAARGRGLIASVTTDAAVNAYETWGAYGISKAAQDHMLRSFHAELARFGVKCISVDPGEMDTVMYREAVPNADPSTLANPAKIAEKLAYVITRAVAPDAGYERIDLAIISTQGAA